MVGAALAESLVVASDFAVVVDAFSALVAGDAGGFVAGHLAGVEGNLDPLFGEEVFDGQLAVGEHLLLILVGYVRVKVAGALLGRLAGGDADGFVGGVGVGEGRCEGWVNQRVQVDEGGGHFAPVAEFEGSFAEATAGDDADGVGGAAVNLEEGDEALAIEVGGAVGERFGLGVRDAQALEAKDGHADAEDLAGAEVAVGQFGLADEGVEVEGVGQRGRHDVMILRLWRVIDLAAADVGARGHDGVGSGGDRGSDGAPKGDAAEDLACSAIFAGCA